MRAGMMSLDAEVSGSRYLVLLLVNSVHRSVTSRLLRLVRRYSVVIEGIEKEWLVLRMGRIKRGCRMHYGPRVIDYTYNAPLRMHNYL